MFPLITMMKDSTMSIISPRKLRLVDMSLKNRVSSILKTSVVIVLLLVTMGSVVFGQNTTKNKKSVLAPRGSTLDPSSYSNVEQFTVSHIDFELFVDFTNSSLIGNVTHTLKSVDDTNHTMVYMDVRDGLVIHSAHFYMNDTVDGCPPSGTHEEVIYEISTPNPNIGSALDITLPCTIPKGINFYLLFHYQTYPNSTALSWLTPIQTAGKLLPYMYSLCQMNFCRDLAPMMDTPSQKITYNATVIVPNTLVAYMSANSTDSGVTYDDNHTIYTFVNEIKIPSYLIAIVVGDLSERKLDSRVSIISEPAYLDDAANEFEELPELLDMVESYLLPYIWGRYSIVIMPPSFPWGGMEHPLVTFASHTLISGDKSQVSTAIHELTHSYFGNDVGCQNWDNFWLNEGINVFMERKILQMWRDDEYMKLEYSNGNASLFEDFESYGFNNSYSSLYPSIGLDDPENSFSGVPYEKGSQFVYYMETLLGEDLMQLMLQQYLTNFSQMAINYKQFQTFYEDFVTMNLNSTTSPTSEMVINQTDWDKWVLEPGSPPIASNFTTLLLSDSEALANEYIVLKGLSSPENYTKYNSFLPIQQLAFVQALTDAGNQTNAEILAIIDQDLNMTMTINAPIKNAWYVLGIYNNYTYIMEPCHKWMGEQGRNYYVRQTFSALVDVGMCETALDWFNEYTLFYNSYVVNGVEGILEDCNITSTTSPSSTPTITAGTNNTFTIGTANTTSDDDTGTNVTAKNTTSTSTSDGSGTNVASTLFGLTVMLQVISVLL